MRSMLARIALIIALFTSRADASEMPEQAPQAQAWTVAAPLDIERFRASRRAWWAGFGIFGTGLVLAFVGAEAYVNECLFGCDEALPTRIAGPLAGGAIALGVAPIVMLGAAWGNTRVARDAGLHVPSGLVTAGEVSLVVAGVGVVAMIALSADPTNEAKEAGATVGAVALLLGYTSSIGLSAGQISLNAKRVGWKALSRADLGIAPTVGRSPGVALHGTW